MEPNEESASPEDPAARLLAEAYERWRQMPPARLNITREDAWITMMGLQQVVAHPDIAGGPLGERMTAVGRAIQEAVCDDPQLYAIAEAGWNRAFDVDRETGR